MIIFINNKDNLILGKNYCKALSPFIIKAEGYLNGFIKTEITTENNSPLNNVIID